MLFAIRKSREFLSALYEQDKQNYKNMLRDKADKERYISRADVERLRVISHYQSLIRLRKKHILKVLTAYITENLASKAFIEQIFECKFDETKIKETLEEEDFVLFLIKVNLVNRFLALEFETRGQLKLRIYSAILNYDKLKKELA